MHARKSPGDGGLGLEKALHDFRVKKGLTNEPYVPPAVRVTTAEERANKALQESIVKLDDAYLQSVGAQPYNVPT